MPDFCPHCSRRIDIPAGAEMGDEFRCPYCLMELKVTGQLFPKVEHASIEFDMMWDDDTEMGWADDDDDDDDW